MKYFFFTTFIVTLSYFLLSTFSYGQDIENQVKEWEKTFFLPQTPPLLQQQLAKNMALYHQEHSHFQQSLKWSTLAIELTKPLSSIDAHEAAAWIPLIIHRLFLHRQLTSAANLASTAFKKFCHYDSSFNNYFHQHAIRFYLAENQPQEAIKVWNLGKNCQMSKEEKAKSLHNIIRYLAYSSSYYPTKFLKKHINSPSYIPHLINKFAQNSEEGKTVLQLFEQWQSQRQEMVIEDLDAVAKVKLIPLQHSFTAWKTLLPTQPWEKALQEFDAHLQEAKNLMDLKSPIALNEGYKITLSLYQLIEQRSEANKIKTELTAEKNRLDKLWHQLKEKYLLANNSSSLPHFLTMDR